MTDGYAGYRSALVESLQLKGIHDMAVLRAVATVPRHLFVPDHLRHRAYEDVALPLSADQTISQPWVQARSCELLRLQGRERVLEIGTGSGYQTALLAMLAETVFSIERIADLARKADDLLRHLDFRNVTVRHGDGTLGWRAVAPFDAIVVAAASPDIPLPLVSQLSAGGRMVLPLGTRDSQTLTLVTRHLEGSGYDQIALSGVRFVPLLGEFGFNEAQ